MERKKKTFRYYTTFSVWMDVYTKDRIAVECETSEDSKAVASDANSLDGVSNIRLRTSSKPDCVTISKKKNITNTSGYEHVLHSFADI